MKSIARAGAQRLKRNNFDLLRLVFALVVCVVHIKELTGFAELARITQYLSSSVAIKSFFVVSGFLVFMSFDRTRTLSAYAGKRLRRIYPAYAVVVIVCAIGLFVVSNRPFGQYFSLAWLEYLVANLSFLNFLQPSLPGVFEEQRWGVVNGALWTLKIEVLFYFSVPVFALLFKQWGRLKVLLITYCGSIAYSLILLNMAGNTDSSLLTILARQLPAQLSYFMAGAFFFYYMSFFERHYKKLVLLSVAVLLAYKQFPLVLPLILTEPIALACIVVFFSLFMWLGNFGKYGDFSYGCYIVHFPIIQLMLQLGWLSDRPYYFAITAVCLTLIVSVLVWHLIEKRFLLRSSHYLEKAPA